MSPSWEGELVDPFLAEVPAEAPEAFEDLTRATAEEAGIETPAASLRATLLGAAKVEGRLDRFASTVARMLDLPEDGARALLDRVARPDVWEEGLAPGVSLFHVSGGPRVEGHVTGFVRMPQGVIFPEHQHLGAEEVLVLQGSYVDGVTGIVYRPGDVIRMPAESRHDFRARAGPNLVYLVVLAEGVDIDGVVMRADDPRL
jgi:quercetin dioxygenase-like cupin family protein